MLSWSTLVMTRRASWLAAILFICLAINGVLFVLRKNGVGPFELVEDGSQSEGNAKDVWVFQQKSVINSGINKTEKNVNPHDVKFLINHPEFCKENPELIIIVCVSIPNSKGRHAVRQTWGSYANDTNHKSKLLFLVGQSDDKGLRSSLLNESIKYADIIQADFHDSYRNLSIKSLAMLRWVTTYCKSAKYLLKADDDMYINVPNLLTSLRKQTQEKFVLGCVIVNAHPIQDKKSKWYTPKKYFKEKVYPRYTSGTAYSMSIKAAADLYAASQKLDMFWLEDIYITGLCARKAGISILNDNGFTYQKRKAAGCTFKSVISGHHNSIEEIYKIHKELYANPRPKC